MKLRRLSLDELSEQAEAFDSAVEATAGIDHFCSASDWIIPAARSLMPARESWIHTAEDCYWAFMEGQHPEGFSYLEPLEAMWALACPTLGADNEALVEGLEHLCEMPGASWKIMALPGLGAGHPLLSAVVSRFADRWELGLGQSAVRLLIDLDGIDEFLARRSKHFRRSLQRSLRDAAQAAIVVEDASHSSAADLIQRIMAVEARGWKGQQGVGITEGAMHDFYKLMLPRLSQRGAVRVLFARQGERDVAYIFGGLRLEGYRGLQFSFDEEYRAYGLGNLLQYEQITRLCSEGVKTYDLGMHMEYKLRWADRQRETLTLLLLRP